MIKMAEAASSQAVEEGKKRLREFLEPSTLGQQSLSRNSTEEYEMSKIKTPRRTSDMDDDEDDGSWE